MELDRIEQMNLLFDFYGQLLTQRQQEVLNLYYGENLSLAEIAQEFSISRQGVHDALKNAQNTLQGYEAKLNLVQKFQETNRAIMQIDNMIEQMIQEGQQDKEGSLPGNFPEKLGQIKDIIDKLD
jgi:predicted DNA-binding protein YlxM (UPF0122 family)